MSSDERNAQLRAVTIGPLERLDGGVILQEYDPRWPQQFTREAERIRTALGKHVVELEHVGSTSVPGLVAKPRIDMLLVVADSADEPAHVPALEAVGYRLRIREPDWHEHRMFNGPDIDVTSMCSAQAARRSSACFGSATISMPIGQTASAMRPPSVSLRRATGATCR